MLSSTRRRLLAGAGSLATAALLRKPAGAEELLSMRALRPTDPPAPLPPISWTLPDGTERTLADHAGQGVVLNFWATWCEPCVAEMPALEQLAKALRADRAVVLPLSSDRGGAAAVERFYKARGITALPVLLDPRGAAIRAMHTRGIPTTLVLDRAGKERARLEGAADWGGNEALATIRRLIGPVAEGNGTVPL